MDSILSLAIVVRAYGAFNPPRAAHATFLGQESTPAPEVCGTSEIFPHSARSAKPSVSRWAANPVLPRQRPNPSSPVFTVPILIPGTPGAKGTVAGRPQGKRGDDASLCVHSRIGGLPVRHRPSRGLQPLLLPRG